MTHLLSMKAGSLVTIGAIAVAALASVGEKIVSLPAAVTLGSVRCKVSTGPDNTWMADPGVPGLVFTFAPTEPSENSEISLHEAVFVTRHSSVTGCPIRAELHHLIGHCEQCGGFVAKPSHEGEVACPGCSFRLRCRTTPRDTRSADRSMVHAVGVESS